MAHSIQGVPPRRPSDALILAVRHSDADMVTMLLELNPDISDRG